MNLLYKEAIIFLLACCLFISTYTQSQIPSFPGAEGYGSLSVGGRGGTVIEVTTLADSVPAPAGSFRACLEASGPRTCVFKVGGIIQLASPLSIMNPYLTIAGQTAPGGGILITGNKGIEVKTHNIIIRYLRFRLYLAGTPNSGGSGCISITNRAYNVIVDHCSSSWALDDNIHIWKNEWPPSPDLTNITIQRCFIAETLRGHSTGMLIGGQEQSDADSNLPSDVYLNVYNISVHHNLFAHNYDRNPQMGSAGTEVINNVVYNWGDRVGVSQKKNTVDLINNYWKPGPMIKSLLIYKHERMIVYKGWIYPDPDIYIAGNIVEGNFTNPSADNWPLILKSQDSINDPNAWQQLPSSYRRYTPLTQSPFPIFIDSATEAYSCVMADVGANARLDCQGNWVPNYDSVDIRVLADVNNGTGWATLPPESPTEAGGFPNIAGGTACADTDQDGMPDAWEITNGFNPTNGSDGSLDLDGDGYTNLEEYLNGTVTSCPSFPNNVEHIISFIGNCTVYPNPASGKFTIERGGEQGPRGKLEIYNALGEKVIQSTINHQTSTIDLSAHPAGIYFVKIQTLEGQLKTAKLVVQK